MRQRYNVMDGFPSCNCRLGRLMPRPISASHSERLVTQEVGPRDGAIVPAAPGVRNCPAALKPLITIASIADPAGPPTVSNLPIKVSLPIWIMFDKRLNPNPPPSSGGIIGLLGMLPYSSR